MKTSKKEFIEFMLASGVLKFGDFVTKSGRATPYFINTGFYNDGAGIERLGRFYAECIAENVPGDIATIYGPSYKGVPLAVSAAIALRTHHGRNLHYSFNRKEAKDHGEGGVIVGYVPRDGDGVVIVEDVITAGTSIHESMEILAGLAAVRVRGIVLSVDRMEKGQTDKTAVREVQDRYGVPVFPLVTIEEVVDYLYNVKEGGRAILGDDMKRKIEARIVK